MKKKIPYIIAYWWVMTLFALGFFILIVGNRAGGFSQSENRDLQGAPSFSLKNWFDGVFAREAEAYLSDQFPERDPVVKTADRLLAAFDATSEKERILDQSMIMELEGMNEGTEPVPDEPIASDEPEDVTIPVNATPAPEISILPTLPVSGTPTPAPETDATPAPTPVDPAVKNTSTVRRFSLKRSDGSLYTRFQFGQDAIEDTVKSLNAYRAASGICVMRNLAQSPPIHLLSRTSRQTLSRLPASPSAWISSWCRSQPRGFSSEARKRRIMNNHSLCRGSHKCCQLYHAATKAASCRTANTLHRPFRNNRLREPRMAWPSATCISRGTCQATRSYSSSRS